MANRIQFDECTPDLIRDDWLFCSNTGVIARFIWHRSVDSGIFPIEACVMNTEIEIVAMDDHVHAGEDAIHVVDENGEGGTTSLDKVSDDTIIMWYTLICVLVVLMTLMTIRTRVACVLNVYANVYVNGAPPVEAPLVEAPPVESLAECVAVGATPYDHDGGTIVKEVAVGEDHVEDRHLAETPRLLPPATKDMLKTQEGINCESDVRREVDNDKLEKKPATQSTNNSVIKSKPKPSGKPAAKVVCDLSNNIVRSAEKKSRLPSAPSMQHTSPTNIVTCGSRIPRRPS